VLPENLISQRVRKHPNVHTHVQMTEGQKFYLFTLIQQLYPA